MDRTVRTISRLRGAALFRVVMLGLVVGVLSLLAALRVEPPWRADWFDLMQRVMPRAPMQDSPVRIVAVQETDFQSDDQWLWPRDRIARLVDQVGQGGARVIGLDMMLDGLGIFEVAEAKSGSVMGPDKTIYLSDIMKQWPVISPVIAFEQNAMAAVHARRTRGVDAETHLPQASDSASIEWARQLLPHSPGLDGLIRAHPALVRAASAEAVMIDELGGHGTHRTVPMVRVVTPDGGVPVRYHSMAAEMVRLARNDGTIRLRRGRLGQPHMQIGTGVAVPLEASGNMRLYLRARDQSLYIDGNDLYRGRVDPAVFKDKLVLISLSVGDFSGLLDTPLFGVAMTAELQAQMIEQMLSGDYLMRPDWGVWAEIGMVLLLGLAILWLVPALRPIWAIPVAFGVAVFAVPLSLLAFAGPGLVFDGLGVAVSLMIVGASAFGSALVERDHQHRAMELTLAVERAAKSRLEGELDVARRIQMGLLPEATSTPVPSLEIACHIAPARVVGGDFYDHIVRTDGQVFFLIADVSGKGVPASLFMALSKSLWKSAALRRDDLGEIQSLANHEITRDNSDHMFVTGVACMFDPSRCTLQYCGAGHDMPILARPGQSAISLPEAAGPPLGLQDGPSFPVGQIPLAPGDLVCLFTDGLTEAELTCLPDGGALPGPGPMYFGAEGVALGLEQAAAQGLSAQQTVAHINALLGRVTEDADQTDDRTLVVIRAL